jgi:hypothetical protein
MNTLYASKSVISANTEKSPGSQDPQLPFEGTLLFTILVVTPLILRSVRRLIEEARKLLRESRKLFRETKQAMGTA